MAFPEALFPPCHVLSEGTFDTPFIVPVGARAAVWLPWPVLARADQAGGPLDMVSGQSMFTC